MTKGEFLKELDTEGRVEVEFRGYMERMEGWKDGMTLSLLFFVRVSLRYCLAQYKK
jgi:hypothetical protein